MKEIQQLPVNRNVVWPQESNVIVENQTDFVYIMRKDMAFTVEPIAEKLAGDYHLEQEKTAQVIYEKYDTFFAELAELITWGFAERGNVQLHLYDPDYLETRIREKAGEQPLISLDPLMGQDVLNYEVSRAYYQSGKHKYGQVERPGSVSIDDQAKAIAATLGEKTAAIVEDDIFTGGSVIESHSHLDKAGVKVNKTITGLLIGNPPELLERGIAVEGVVSYAREDKGDIFEKVDLGDPRDFLIGASGLVVKLPSGELGRAPYVLPFVSPNARVSIPENKEKLFSEGVLQANYDFFKRLDEQLGEQTCIKHMDPHFATYMYEQHGIPSSTPMVGVVAWMLENSERIWSETEKQGDFLEKLHALNLPQKMILLDVDGTIVSDDASDDTIDSGDTEAFLKEVQSLEKKGISVGLCSDTPSELLLALAKRLGITGPIVAENGTEILHQNKSLVVGSVNEIDVHKEKIRKAAEGLGFNEKDNVVSPVFGGEYFDSSRQEWGFGAHRQQTVSVFGPKELVSVLSEMDFRQGQDVSIGSYPEHNYFSIHPGQEHSYNKGQTLSYLAKSGHSILMVGNTMADWVPPESGVVCAFVKDSRITNEVTDKSAYLSQEPTLKGVIDILAQVNEAYE